MMYPDNEVPLPPQSMEAEESLIGAATINPQGLDEIGFLCEDDFYFGKNKTVWRAIQQLREQRMPVDFVTLSNQLAKTGDLEDVGGPAGLAGMVNAAPTSFNLEGYARIIKDKARRRALLAQANQLAKIAYDENISVEEGVTSVIDQVANCARTPDKTLKHISHGLSALYEFVEMRMQDPKDVWGIPTGFIDIDRFLGGLHGGENFYIAGEPGVGKTRLALQMVLNAALPENGRHPVGIYSFEQSEIEIVKRLVSDRRNITTWDMNSGKIDDLKLHKFCADIEYLESLPIYICDRPMNPNEFHADLVKHIHDDGLDLFMLDYLLLMEGYENMEEFNRAAMLSRKVKNSVQELGVAGITVASVLKEVIGQSGAPTNRGMRGSGQVIHDADIIAFMTGCTEAGMQNVINLTFTKMRNVARQVSVINLISDTIYPGFKDATARNIDLKNVI